ncbi:hypothetical protein ACJJTC_017641 [Scirpophaga incertulas]
MRQFSSLSSPLNATTATPSLMDVVVTPPKSSQAPQAPSKAPKAKHFNNCSAQPTPRQPVPPVIMRDPPSVVTCSRPLHRASYILYEGSSRPTRCFNRGADEIQHPEPSEVPVVAASSQRTKAKPATSDRAPIATEGTAAEIVEQLVQIIKAAFISVMSGESLTTVITRGLMELWGLLSRSWSV